jgi:outer membrane protein TolC
LLRHRQSRLRSLHQRRRPRLRRRRLLAIVLALSPQGAAAETLELQPLIAETLTNNRELRAAESRIAAAGFRITQARGLPDPMVSIGYQNEGLTNYTYGDSPDAQRMTKLTLGF